MTRDQITRNMVEQAVEIYLDLAYEKGRKATKPEVSHEQGDLFELFQDETAHRSESGQPNKEKPDRGRALEKHTMRLGNRNYPFMKLVLQEHIVPGEFYFTVDTHDQMEIRTDFPDYEAWVQVKKFNLELKHAIETAFLQAGLPTIETIRERAESIEEAHTSASGPGSLILIVDDDEAEARALEHLLRVQGYEVARAANGRAALDRLRFLEPALIVLDYEMPEMDGLTLISELRRNETTRKLPLLLTTASEVVASDRQSADGFLAKPFQSRDLIEQVESLLRRK